MTAKKVEVKEADLKPYHLLDQDTGQEYRAIFYDEGVPLQIRADMKFGIFKEGDEEPKDAKTEITITPIAFRAFKGQMFLKKEELEEIEKDKSGELLEKSIKDWIEVFYVADNGLVCCTLFKTWGAKAIYNALFKPQIIAPPGERVRKVEPVFDRTLRIGVEKKKENGYDFYIPIIKEVKMTDKETVQVLKEFANETKLFSIENASQNFRFKDTYHMTKSAGWFNVFKNDFALANIASEVELLENAELQIEEGKEQVDESSEKQEKVEESF